MWNSMRFTEKQIISVNVKGNLGSLAFKKLNFVMVQERFLPPPKFKKHCYKAIELFSWKYCSSEMQRNLTQILLHLLEKPQIKKVSSGHGKQKATWNIWWYSPLLSSILKGEILYFDACQINCNVNLENSNSLYWNIFKFLLYI